MKHQKGAMLNISVDYRLDNTSPSTIDPKIYPDFVPIAEKIDLFLTNYPNKSDYWEILNKKLAQYILHEYPMISSLKIRIDINPSLAMDYNRYPRRSIVTMTRSNSCPLIVF